MNRTIASPAKVGSPSHPRRAFAIAAAAVLVSALVPACMEGRGGQDPSQQQQPYDPNNPYAQQQGPNQQMPYGQQGPYQQGQVPQGQVPPGQYPQGQVPPGQVPQQQYPAQPGQYPQQGPAPGATTPPNPLALPCQNDLICGTHKCNLTTQRCAFPCAANTDCAAGFGCIGAGGPTAICVPGGG